MTCYAKGSTYTQAGTRERQDKMHSYKEQVTTEHDAFCIGAAIASALENAADAGDFTVSLDVVLEMAYGYLAEGLSNCRCMFAGMTGAARIDYLLQFSEDALAAMTGSGYWNDSTGERMTITDADYVAVYETRNERDANWLAETLANEAVGDQNSYSAVVASDTDAQPVYSLVVNGEKSEHGTYVNKWGIAYAATRELLKAGIDPDSNSGLIAAVLSTLEDGSSVVVDRPGMIGGLELSTVFETN